MNEFKIICCGSRDWTNYGRIKTFLELLPLGCTIIEGECEGADLLSRKAAEELGFLVVPFPADWGRYKKRAGPIRNQQMLDEGKPSVVVAFHDDLPSSKGTLDMLTKACKAGVYCLLITELSGAQVTLEELKVYKNDRK